MASGHNHGRLARFDARTILHLRTSLLWIVAGLARRIPIANAVRATKHPQADFRSRCRSWPPRSQSSGSPPRHQLGGLNTFITDAKPLKPGIATSRRTEFRESTATHRTAARHLSSRRNTPLHRPRSGAAHPWRADRILEPRTENRILDALAEDRAGVGTDTLAASTRTSCNCCVCIQPDGRAAGSAPRTKQHIQLILKFS